MQVQCQKTQVYVVYYHKGELSNTGNTVSSLTEQVTNISAKPHAVPAHAAYYSQINFGQFYHLRSMNWEVYVLTNL